VLPRSAVGKIVQLGATGKKRKTCANEMRTVDVGKLHSKSASQPTGRITIGLILSVIASHLSKSYAPILAGEAK
jgi:hypothetical protein